MQQEPPIAESRFQFGEYIVRPIREGDRTLLTRWIEADPYHAGRVLPDFFLKNVPGEDSWALEDRMGFVVFYFKTQVSVRLHIQFDGNQHDIAVRERNRKALIEGLDWLEGRLRENKFREIGFQTSNPVLAVFAKRNLGFQGTSGELVREIRRVM